MAPTDFQEKDRGAKERNPKVSCQVYSSEWLMQNELNICYKVRNCSAETQSFQVGQAGMGKPLASHAPAPHHSSIDPGTALPPTQSMNEMFLVMDFASCLSQAKALLDRPPSLTQEMQDSEREL